MRPTLKPGTFINHHEELDMLLGVRVAPMPNINRNRRGWGSKVDMGLGVGLLRFLTHRTLKLLGLNHA